MEIVLGVVMFTFIIVGLVVLLMAAKVKLVPDRDVRIVVNGDTENAIEVKAGVDFEQNIAVRKGIARNIRVTALAGSGPWISLALRTANQDYTWLVGQPRNDS